MVKLQEVVTTVASNDWRDRYKYEIRDIFINPKHIQYIRPNNNKNLRESLANGSGDYCTLWIQGREMTVVGTLKQLEERLFSKKGILHD